MQRCRGFTRLQVLFLTILSRKCGQQSLRRELDPDLYHSSLERV